MPAIMPDREGVAMDGRRVASLEETEKPGDYAGPLTITSASIMNYAHGGCPDWHGYPAEGHAWRQA